MDRDEHVEQLVASDGAGRRACRVRRGRQASDRPENRLLLVRGAQYARDAAFQGAGQIRKLQPPSGERHRDGVAFPEASAQLEAVHVRQLGKAERAARADRVDRQGFEGLRARSGMANRVSCVFEKTAKPQGH